VTEREQAALREMRKFVEADQAAEHERQWQPVKEQQEEFEKNVKEYRKLLRDLTLTRPLQEFEPTIFDGIPKSQDDVPIDQALSVAKFAVGSDSRYAGLQEHERAEVGKLLHKFVRRNKLDALRPESWRRAFEVLSFSGAIKTAPEPQPEPAPEQPDVRPEPEAPEQSKRDTMTGVDPATGEPREYSTFEIERMSSEEYKNVFIGQYRTPRINDVITRQP
jgi:hypothetical protein